MTERITSRRNPLVRHLHQLAASSAYRREAGEFLGDGKKLLEEAVQWGAPLRTVVYTPDTPLPSLPEDVRRVEMAADIFSSASSVDSPQGVLFTVAMPPRTPPAALEGARYLALEGVQDPGNVGTVWRTADALGADGLLLLPGCADPFAPKTVRASMGAVFRLPIWFCTLETLDSLAQRANLPLWGAALGQNTMDARTADLHRGIIVIGSEGRGLTSQALKRCHGTVRIPMAARCESLNAAVAAAILLWEGVRTQPPDSF